MKYWFYSFVFNKNGGIGFGDGFQESRGDFDIKSVKNFNKEKGHIIILSFIKISKKMFNLQKQ